MDRYVAFIPVRGGSKSIPLKNIKELNGKPLVYWTVKAACDSEHIGRVYVSTDSEEIRKTVSEFGFDKVSVVNRSPETASDTASTESAMLEFANSGIEFANIVLIQATSPLLRKQDLDKGIEEFERKKVDSLFSGVRKKQFLWYDKEGVVFATYDYNNRPRRQEYAGYIVENGAFYVTSRENLLKSRCRLSGNVGIYEMPDRSIFEIDEPEDWFILESIMKVGMKPEM